MSEKWKDILNYEGEYQVSTAGNVRSLDRIALDGRFIKSRMLKPGIMTSGYKFVVLRKDGKSNNISIHRLVALTFIKNPLNKLEVNHIDEDRLNNTVENLEWMTRIENVNHGKGITKNAKRHKKPIVQYSSSGDYIKDWDSARDIFRATGYKYSPISNCCNGRTKSSYGFIWRFKNVENGS